MSRTSPHPAAAAAPLPDRMDRWWAAITVRLPLAVFVGVYLFTCYVGALALLLSDRFRTVFVVFSGAKTPDLTGHDIVVSLALLHLAPLFVWAGYELGVRIVPRATRADGQADGADHSVWVARLLVAGTVLGAFVSLARADGWHGFAAWFDYNSYVYARWQLYDRLQFIEFVNIYTMLPLSVAYLALVERRRKITIVAIALLFLLQYPLASRKVLLTSALIIGAAVYLYRYFGERSRHAAAPRRHLALVLGGALAMYVTYLGLTVQTVIDPHSTRFLPLRDNIPSESAPAAVLPDPGPVRLSFRIDADAVNRVEGNRRRAVILLALFSPLTRTSISALVYPAVFPRLHPYYPLDLGQDILRFGSMPDDNLTVYRVLWPEHHRGSISAPFSVVLYAQGGLIPALCGSFVVGLALAGSWRRLVAGPCPSAASCLYGALIIVLAIFLAIDSLRNSLIVSYGLLWGMLAVYVVSAMGMRLPGRMHARPRAVGAG